MVSVFLFLHTSNSRREKNAALQKQTNKRSHLFSLLAFPVRVQVLMALKTLLAGANGVTSFSGLETTAASFPYAGQPALASSGATKTQLEEFFSRFSGRYLLRSKYPPFFCVVIGSLGYCGLIFSRSDLAKRFSCKTGFIVVLVGLNHVSSFESRTIHVLCGFA